MTGGCQGVLDFPDAQRAEVEDGSREYGVRAGVDRWREVLDASSTSAGNHRDRYFAADQPDQVEVEPVLGAVGVHRVEQDLAGTDLGGPMGPLDGVEAGARAAAMRGDLESAFHPGRATGVDGENQHLVSEPVGDLSDQVGSTDCRGVHRDLVGSGAQQPVDVLDRTDPAPDSKRDEHLLGGGGHDFHGGRAALVRGGDVEERELVGALGVVQLAVSYTHLRAHETDSYLVC